MANSLEDVDETVLTVMSSIEAAASADSLTRIKICLSEALYNLVLHAQVEDKSGSIDVILTVKGDHVELEIFDPVGAVPFDLTSHAGDLSEVDVMAESGRGLALIMECSNNAAYGPAKDGRNRLALGFEG